MIAKAKSISHGINDISYITAVSYTHLELHTLSFLCGLHHFFIRCVQPTKPNVFEQRGIELVLILCHIGASAVECFKTHIA